MLSLQEMYEKFKMLSVCEERCVTYEYGELVFHSEDIEAWDRKFTEMLGPAVKPPNTKPSREDIKLTEVCGGVRYDQTLFKKEFDNSIVVAMFWPWQDKLHVTLKVILLRKDD